MVKKVSKKKIAKKKAPKKAPAKKASRKTVPFKARAKAERKNASEFAYSQAELCEKIGCSRSTITRMSRRPGCPKKTADGRYHWKEWKKFIESEPKDPTPGDLVSQRKSDAEARLKEAKAKDAELELAEREGRLIDVDEAIRVIGEAFGGMVVAMKELDTTLSPIAAGLSVAQCTKAVRKELARVLERFTIGEWAKKKPFWRAASESLQNLQMSDPLGVGPNGTW